MRSFTILAVSVLALAGCQSTRSSSEFTGAIAPPCFTAECRSDTPRLGAPSDRQSGYSSYPNQFTVNNKCIPEVDAAAFQGVDRLPLTEMIAMPISSSSERDVYRASIQSHPDMQLPSELAQWKENRSAENQLTAFAPPPVIDIEAIRSTLNEPRSSSDRVEWASGI